METKYCRRCEETKPLSEFHRGNKAKDGCQTYCKSCCSAYAAWYNIEYAEKKKKASAKYYRENRDKILMRMAARYTEQREEIKHSGWERNLRHKYGIGVFEYDLMLELQDNGCAICGMTPEENGKRLAVDHDHNTGKVRGLLCSGCNKGLGFFRDNPEICGLAEIYLRRTENK